MKKTLKYIVLFVFFMVNITMNAQNLALYFELIPDAHLSHLKPDLRKGMVGMYELGQRPARVPDMLGGICVLDTLSNDYLSMHTSDVSTLSIKMHQCENDSINLLVVVKTVKVAGSTDSGINFFTNTWSKLESSKYIDVPTVSDFYVTNEEVSLDEFSRFCIPLLITYKFNDDNSLSATIDPEKYLPVEIYKKISPAFSKKPVTYIWDGNRYQKN